MVPTTRLLLLEKRDHDQANQPNENTTPTPVVPVAGSTETSVVLAAASTRVNLVTTLNTPELEPLAPPDGSDEQ